MKQLGIIRIIGIAWLLGSSLTACLPGANITDGAAGDAGVDSNLGFDAGGIGGYFENLPGWDEFSPQGIEPGESTDPVEGETREQEPVVVDEVKEYSGETKTTLPPHEYRCETTSYSLETNPKDIVMLNPDSELLWPGALIQGRTHRDKVGSLAELPIRQRAPLKITIDELKSAREVSDVSKGGMNEAVKEMLQEERASGLATPGRSHFEMEVYQSEQQFAARMDVSGRYLGFMASASGAIEKTKAETTVTVLYYDRMYTVDVELPQSPEEIFSEEFTPELLQKEIDRGRIGPDNLPVYISQIVYGRILMFSMTSTATEDQMRAAINASWRNVGAEASVELEAEHSNILNEAKYSIASIGGDRKAIEATIRSGDWKEYFTGTAALSTAVPMIYTFRNLGDNSIASVIEATDYEVETCSATPVTDAAFAFTAAVEHEAPIPSPMALLKGDFNGDGRVDLLWNHLSANSNQFYVGHGNEDGGFDLPELADGTLISYQHPEDLGWGAATVTPLVGDMNADGRDDVVWTILDDGSARFYVAFATADAGFDFSPVMLSHGEKWGDYVSYIGDYDGDGAADLYLNSKRDDRNVLYIAESLVGDDGSFSSEMRGYLDRGEHYTSYHTFVEDLDGNGTLDIVWNNHGDLDGERRNDIWQSIIGPSNTTETTSDGWNWRSTGYQPGAGGSGLQKMTALLGTISTDSYPDFLWVPKELSPNPEQKLTYSEAMRYPNTAYVDIGYAPVVETTLNADDWVGLRDLEPGETVPVSAALLDIDATGGKDLLLSYAIQSQLYLVTGSLVADGTRFDFGREQQQHPASENWSGFKTLTGDIDGDQREDIIWNKPAKTNTIYVARAR